VAATAALDFRLYLKDLCYGKRLPGTIYLHRETTVCNSGPMAAVLDRVAALHALGSDFNVVKLRTDAPRLSFLAYPAFFEDPHPALERGLALDLSTGRSYCTDYRDNINPPILHRKELLLEPGERRRRCYRLTPAGRKFLKAQRNAWEEFVATINHIVRPSHA